MARTKPILVLDFDGVMSTYTSGWRGVATIVDPPVPGLFPFLIEAHKCFRICVYSSRSKSFRGRWAMQMWLGKHAVDYCGGRILPELRKVLRSVEWPRTKPPASVTLDDRALNFDGVWPKVYDLVSFKPWNKRSER